MAESLHDRIERIEREYRATSRFGRFAEKRIRHWNEIGEEEALWIRMHPKSPYLLKHKKNKERVNRKEAWWRRRRAKSDRRRAKLRKALTVARRAWRRQRRRRWRRAPIKWSGNPRNVSHRVKLVIRFSQNRRGFKAIITSTTGGVHSVNSWHYNGKAVDEIEEEMKRLQEALLDHFGAEYFLELFGPCNWYVKNGVKYEGPFPDHKDHIHAAA